MDEPIDKAATPGGTPEGTPAPPQDSGSSPDTTAGPPVTPASPSETPGAAAPERSAPRPSPASNEPIYWATGRRKTAVARVRLRRGTGRILVNGRTVEDFFPVAQRAHEAVAPLVVTETRGQFDIWANVRGGGLTGQAGAVSLGVARALRAYDIAHDKPLRDCGLLTRDARMAERKKYGQRGARRRFQFSKR